MSRESDVGDPLASEVVEAIAQRVAELLRTERDGPPQLLTPAEVANRFGVSRAWVYEHAERLGAIRLGPGPKARLRFDPDRVARTLSRASSRPPQEAQSPPPAASKRAKTGGRLLPIYGSPDRG